jgi:hypothetical protein
MAEGSDIDAYGVLGLRPSADDVVIRAAWKALIRKHHPDSSTAPDAAEQAAKINAAFKLLGTPDARAAYDRSRTLRPVAPPPSKPRPAAAAPAPAPPPPRRRWKRFRRFAMVGVAFAMTGGATVYLAHNDLALPAPVERLGDEFLTNARVSQARANARRILGLDRPRNVAAEPAGPAEKAPPPAVDEAAVTAAISEFGKFAARRDGSAAAEGRKCSASTQSAPSWSALDRCVALHIAGLGTADSLFGSPDPSAVYFRDVAVGLPERYAALSIDDAGISSRIEKIRKIVWSAMLSSAEWDLRASGGRPVLPGHSKFPAESFPPGPNDPFAPFPS